MADFEFNLNEITSLAQKLSTVQPDLTPQEYKLLLAIFAAAAAHAEITNSVARTSTLPEPGIFGEAAGTITPAVTPADLQQQLLNAYIPGNYFDAVDTEIKKTVGLQSPTAQAENPGAGGGGQPGE